jgi:RNA polymerase sigma-70 factor, ECF subfamily
MSNQKPDCNSFTDKEIFKLSLEDVTFYRCLFERYESRLKSYIKRISGFDPEEIDDVLQNAFIKIWKNLNNYDESVEVSGFIYNVVHNETISLWRKMSSTRKIKEYLSQNTTYIVEQNNEDTKETNVEISRIIGKMPEKYREVIILKFFENMDYEEISYILRIPEGTVATRINRAKAYFAKIADKTKFNY